MQTDSYYYVKYISENKYYFLREPTLDDHDHVPNQEECETEIVKYSLKQKAENQPQLPTAQILRTKIAGLSDEVLSQLPNRDNFKKINASSPEVFIFSTFPRI